MTDAGGLLEQYQQSVAAGRLLPDEGQAACVTRLSTLADQLVGYSISLAAHRQTLQEYQVGSSASCPGYLLSVWSFSPIGGNHTRSILISLPQSPAGYAEAEAAGAEGEGRAAAGGRSGEPQS